MEPAQPAKRMQRFHHTRALSPSAGGACRQAHHGHRTARQQFLSRRPQRWGQRLGRILRPKAGRNQAHFYTLVSGDTVEQEFALRRQLFLCEQGYTYEIVDAPMDG